MTINKRIEEIKIYYFGDKHGSHKQFIEKVGVASNTASNWMKDGYSVGKGVIDQILVAFPDVSYAWLLTGEGEMLKSDKKETLLAKKVEIETRPRIPLNAAAGSISVALDGVTNDDSEQLPFVSAFSNYNYTILVKGDSMEPEFMSGDELACLQLTNGKARFIQWGRYHVLDTAQGVVVKRIYDNGEYILCKSENKELYPDFQILKEDIYNIGLVIGMLRRY